MQLSGVFVEGNFTRQEFQGAFKSDTKSHLKKWCFLSSETYFWDFTIASKFTRPEHFLYHFLHQNCNLYFELYFEFPNSRGWVYPAGARSIFYVEITNWGNNNKLKWVAFWECFSRTLIFNFLIVCGRAIKQGRGQHFKLRSKLGRFIRNWNAWYFLRWKQLIFCCTQLRKLFCPVSRQNSNPKFQGWHLNKNIDHHQISFPRDQALSQAFFCNR